MSTVAKQIIHSPWLCKRISHQVFIGRFTGKCFVSITLFSICWLWTQLNRFIIVFLSFVLFCSILQAPVAWMPPPIFILKRRFESRNMFLLIVWKGNTLYICRYFYKVRIMLFKRLSMSYFVCVLHFIFNHTYCGKSP